MVRHKRVYLKYFGYGEQDFIPSEYSGARAEHIHHLVFQSDGGPDEIWNLMAVTGDEHDRVHKKPGGVWFNDELKLRHAEILRMRGDHDNADKILQTMRSKIDES